MCGKGKVGIADKKSDGNMRKRYVSDNMVGKSEVWKTFTSLTIENMKLK